MTKKALVLIPCCKRKNASSKDGDFVTPIAGLEDRREELKKLVMSTHELASKPENILGILGDKGNAVMACHLYTGWFYGVTGHLLEEIATTNRFPQISILIVSAFYGLVRLNEGIKIYELEMSSRLYGRGTVYSFWRKAELWRYLNLYVDENDIEYIWSLLPSSMPRFPYHQVFSEFWKGAPRMGLKCFHVRIPGAGSNTGYMRATWLRKVLEEEPDFLLGKNLSNPGQSWIEDCVFPP